MSQGTSSDIKVPSNPSYPTVYFPKPKKIFSSPPLSVSFFQSKNISRNRRRRCIEGYSDEEIEQDFLIMNLKADISDNQKELFEILSRANDQEIMTTQIERACNPFYKNFPIED